MVENRHVLYGFTVKLSNFKEYKNFFDFFKKGIDKWYFVCYNIQARERHVSEVQKKHGGIAQLARAPGSYPVGRRFKSHFRYHNGPLVKRLRHRPFTAVTWVRFPYGSPKKITSEPKGSDVIFLSKQQAWHGINALLHCMESPKAYGITRLPAA